MLPIFDLQKSRLEYPLKTPPLLEKAMTLRVVEHLCDITTNNELAKLFPNTNQQPILTFTAGNKGFFNLKRVGVVFSGGQASGGHNVIIGLFRVLKQLNNENTLVGFLNGPSGIIEGNYRELHADELERYLNQGGFDLIGSGRTKIETPEQFEKSLHTVTTLNLDGLVVIGGDDSNTNAAFLAEYFLAKNCKTRVIGVPKTIDGDLKNNAIEVSFGFDTATKVYCEIIGNLMRDALSAKKSYFFIKIMGRAASHIALECALKTHPNMVLISEEIVKLNKSLKNIVSEIADVISERSKIGKEYGVILIPEGIIEFIPEFKILIDEINTLNHTKPHLKKLSTKEKMSEVETFLSIDSVICFKQISEDVRRQLLLEPDSHGNVQVAKIESERLLIDLVHNELENRKKQGIYNGSFSAQPYFCGYEGRSCFPSNFDAQYCYTLGMVSGLLVCHDKTGYMSCVKNLSKPVEQWEIAGIPLLSMMGMEKRQNKIKCVIKKALVDLNALPFHTLQQQRDFWTLEDNYCYPGPIQFFGPAKLSESITDTLFYESINRT